MDRDNKVLCENYRAIVNEGVREILIQLIVLAQHYSPENILNRIKHYINPLDITYYEKLAIDRVQKISPWIYSQVLKDYPDNLTQEQLNQAAHDNNW